ncbi:mediator of RNA polymerase II transcription subunit 11-like [Watersipora subatra]|uniref:mediator of RNA polymerase II transcription subunit 11-like n=1 Tax=Watersipora subatra TaxID=2589382 RepID=UPI00355B2A84
MASSGTAVERLHNLEKIEHDISSALEYASLAAGEYSKDKPNNKTAEGHAHAFLKTVNSIESNLLKQINYLSQVSTTHPHTGSSYGAQKDWQLSVQRTDHVASRLEELEKLRIESSQAMGYQSELRKALSHQLPVPMLGQTLPPMLGQTLPNLPNI